MTAKKPQPPPAPPPSTGSTAFAIENARLRQDMGAMQAELEHARTLAHNAWMELYGLDESERKSAEPESLSHEIEILASMAEIQKLNHAAEIDRLSALLTRANMDLSESRAETERLTAERHMALAEIDKLKYGIGSNAVYSSERLSELKAAPDMAEYPKLVEHIESLQNEMRQWTDSYYYNLERAGERLDLLMAIADAGVDDEVRQKIAAEVAADESHEDAVVEVALGWRPYVLELEKARTDAERRLALLRKVAELDDLDPYEPISRVDILDLVRLALAELGETT